MDFTERQKREIEYYKEYSKRIRSSLEVTFDPVLGDEKRPWNPSWYVHEIAINNFRRGRGCSRLLDFGCGVGIVAIRLAKIGYDAYAFDISEENIILAKSLAEKYDFNKKINFSVQAAENLNYPDEFFDIVIGIDILHHVDINSAIPECYRILKKNGIAIFKEWIEVPVLDRIRNWSLIKRMYSNEMSFERHITHDEKKLIERDISFIKSYFSSCEMTRFGILAKLDKIIRKPRVKTPSLLEKVDYYMIRDFPKVGRLGGTIVLKLTK